MEIKIDCSYDARYANTYFLIEATSFEHQLLWERNKSLLERGVGGAQWDDEPTGLVQGIGEVKIRKTKYPVNISVRWVRLGGSPTNSGLLVCFWHPCSQVVHHGMIEKWFEKHCNPTYRDGMTASTDACNFANCVHAITDPKTWKLKRHGQR